LSASTSASPQCADWRHTWAPASILWWRQCESCHLILTSPYFCFNIHFCEQLDIFTMGSPLSHVTESFFVEDSELSCSHYIQHIHDLTLLFGRIFWNTSTAFTTTSISPWRQTNGHSSLLYTDSLKRPDGSLSHVLHRQQTTLTSIWM
jgi:hypothetical protein